jgi:hypothetical protein
LYWAFFALKIENKKKKIVMIICIKMGAKHYLKEKYFQEMEMKSKFILLERKVFYKPSKSIIFATKYTRKTGIKKIDYRKLIIKRLYEKN